MRVHLVDGTFELFRAHFAKRPPHEAPDGKDLKATVGVVQSLLGLLQDSNEAVTHVAVAFDNPITSFRNALFAGYKTDDGVPPELRAQFDDVEAAVAALGVTVWSMRDFEADDGLASGVALALRDPRVAQVRVLTPDKDLAQCLQGDRVVQVDRMRARTTTEASFRAERGFAPTSVPDFLALVGDTADGIPGLDGWGEKGAALVLGAYPSLEHIPRDVGTWTVRPRGAGSLSATLEQHRDEARLYRTLATLRTDAPVSPSVDALEFRGTERARFTEWCDRVGADTLRDRPKRWLPQLPFYR